MEELEQGTKQFSETSLIGYGSFGPVYMGLLSDTFVVIKRRPGSPRQEFVAEVYNYASICTLQDFSTLFFLIEDENNLCPK